MTGLSMRAPLAAVGRRAAGSEPLPAVGVSGLARPRDFRVVLLGQGVSAVGDAVSVTTVPLLVLALTGSGLMMGIVGALQRLPDLVFGLPAGALADRWDRRRTMLLADLGRAILTAAIPLAALLGFPLLSVLLIVLLPINVLRVVFVAAWTAAVPTLAGRDHLGRATGLMSAVTGASFVVGPVLAGFLVTLIGPAPTLAVDAASFMVSALALRKVSGSLRERDEPARGTVVREITTGVRFVARHPVLRDGIAFSSLVGLVAAPVVPAVSFYLVVDRSLAPAAFGAVMSAYGLGTLLGAVAVGRRLTGRLRAPLLAGTAVVGAATGAIATTAFLPVILLGAFVSGVAMAVVLVASGTLRAATSPDAFLGRVTGTARTASAALQPVGILAGGVLLDVAGGGATLLVVAGASVAVSLAFSASPGIAAAHARSVPAEGRA